VRIASIEGQDAKVRIRAANGQVRIARLGDGVALAPGDRIELLGGPDAEADVQTSQGVSQISGWDGVACPNAARFTGSVEDDGGDGGGGLQQSVLQNTCGEMDASPAGAGEHGRGRSRHQAGGAFALTPEAGARLSGRARLVRDPRGGVTTISSLRGGTQVTPANPALRASAWSPGGACA
jgi:hypothetical protein